MVMSPARRLVTHNDSLHLRSPDGDLGDEQLLAEFLSRDESESAGAFRELVLRHGPMVLGVCRHVLQNDEDADDAFQATFLVLSRKAADIRDRRTLAGWLYEVAYRIAIRARGASNRRRAREREGAAMTAQSIPATHEEAAAWRELQPVLHEEVNRLPEKYRLPVILSYFEGKTNEEVAQHLAWPVGTVKGRLSRARELLRSRLVRRGLAMSAAFLVTSLSRDEVFAEIIPDSLVDRTVAGAIQSRLHLTRGMQLYRESGAEGSGMPGDLALSRVEEFVKLAVRKRRQGVGFIVPLVATLAIAAAGFAVTRTIRKDPTLTRGLDSVVHSIGRAAEERSCH